MNVIQSDEPRAASVQRAGSASKNTSPTRQQGGERDGGVNKQARSSNAENFVAKRKGADHSAPIPKTTKL